MPKTGDYLLKLFESRDNLKATLCNFKVAIGGKQVDAMAYVMNSERRKRAYPSSSYLMTIAKGYQDFGFDVRPLVIASVTK